MKILFVCLGNICRSPLAQAIFNRELKADSLGFDVKSDSCGTGDYHIGDLPDPRTLECARNNNLSIDHQARQFVPVDFENFDFIIAMDQQNFSDVLSQRPGGLQNEVHIFLMRAFDPYDRHADVPDPYWSGEDGFQHVYEILLRSNKQFIEYLKKFHHNGFK